MPKILMVDDNEENREILARWLVRRGYEVTLAADGESALATAPGGGFDLILMDMNLPGIDGREATRRLKADPATRGVIIIAVSAHTMPHFQEQALAAGCDDYDTKPVEPVRLLEKIEAGLAAREAA